METKLREERTKRETKMISDIESLESAERMLEVRVQEEHARISQQEQRLTGMIDEKHQQLLNEITDEKQIRTQGFNSIEGQLREMDDELSEQVESEKLRGQEGDREIVLRVEEDILKFKREL